MSDNIALLREIVVYRLGSVAATELIDVESANVLREMMVRQEIPEPETHEVLGDIRDSPVVRVSHRPILELRETRRAPGVLIYAYMGI